ncbi:MAG: glutamine synthetase III [Lachnospiraceae bacterium]|nr:glutamine synthetase III [Lachnospiraceae bacterium]
MANLAETYGCMVFDDRKMKTYLDPEVYESLRRTIREGKKLDPSVSERVADAMKNWAVENGATHFTHWFQPMNDVTAEKHDSFLEIDPEGTAILSFSGRNLMMGEPDASSFPSGGLRQTFEARGYTIWDASSYAFIKGKTLYIPTAFCSYTGEALDKKTPLLRSMEALNREALRILRLFGNEKAKQVRATVGAEQEYFLIDKKTFYKRRDLVYTGRTLFGACAPKGQEMGDHYFGVIKPRVAAFMEELNEELWKLGIPAKTEHNENAPSQHELACIYDTANVATDNNQLVMEMMQKIAESHGLICLLNEKPFAHVNGSGKHNNWSLATDTGVNLLSPGNTPSLNAQFLLFLVAVIAAVDEYQDLLRISVATASNDNRLGANEAPPAVISMFLGEELTAILEAMDSGEDYCGRHEKTIKLGVDLLPKLPRDTTDRNRTSPFAFTGNKFEFRMVGSRSSIADSNIVINSAVAHVLRKFADHLESVSDFDSALHDLIRDTFRKHKRIVFNGNGYDDQWIKEAVEVRGLSNYPTTPDALSHLLDPKNVELMTSERIYSESELKSRREIYLDTYVKTVEIEARTMERMVLKDILPAILSFSGEVLAEAEKKAAFSAALPMQYERETVEELAKVADILTKKVHTLSGAVEQVDADPDVQSRAFRIRDSILPLMKELRSAADRAEERIPRHLWPFPTYGDLFNSVQ